MKWYYESNGQPQGPILDSELRQLRDESKIPGDCLVWTEGMNDWAPLHSVRPLLQTPSFTAPAAPKLPTLNGADTTLAQPAPPEPPASSPSAPIQPPPPPPADWDLRDPADDTTEYSADRADASGEVEPRWENPGSTGYGPAFLLSACDVLFSTSYVFSRMPRRGGWGRPLAFMALSNILGTVAMLEALSMLPQSNSLLGAAIKTALPVQASSGGMLLSLLSSTFALPLFILCKSAFAHGLLKIGAGTVHPFETTFRTLCYTFAANAGLWFVALAAVLLAKSAGQPLAAEVALVLAMTVGSLWSIYVDIRALSLTHGLNPWRVGLTLILPPLVAFGLLFLASLAMMLAGAA